MIEKIKNVRIYVNGEVKIVEKEKITYEEAIVLAFGQYIESDTINYTVTYFKGHSDKPTGYLLKGQSVMVKKEMRINVTRTNRS